MTSLPRIYLDNAATSWPKPDGVYQAVDRYQREQGAPYGRGGYARAEHVRREVEAARLAVARLIGAAEPRRVIFTSGGTDALNLAIHGTLAEPAHVITTDHAHNSVLRPLTTLARQGRITLTRVAVSPSGEVDPAAFPAAWQRDTRLVVLTHASNVTGAIEPIEAIGRLARELGALVLVDAAQTLGELPLDVARLPIDLLAAPGHKGLLGPLGTGVLYVAPGVEEQLSPTRQGGTGSESELDMQPNSLPDKYESGNPNVPGILGLGAGARWLAEQGIERLRARTLELTVRLAAGLASIAGVRCIGPADATRRVGIVSFTLEGCDPHELAMMLDSGFGIEARAGLHCAPSAHRAAGTLDVGGTVRLSLGPFNDAHDIDAAIEAVRQIAGQGL